MKLKAHQIYCTSNINQVQEVVCTCLDLNRARHRLVEIEKGLYGRKFLTAKPPYFIRPVYFDFEPKAKDVWLF
jgi:hypothetical protein